MNMQLTVTREINRQKIDDINPKRQYEQSFQQQRRKKAYVEFLKIHGWKSELKAVNNLLLRLKRRSRSSSTRENYCYHLYKFSQFVSLSPDEMVRLRRDRAERLVQRFGDDLNDKKSSRYANVAMWAVKAFFRANGFKRNKELEIERYHVPKRARVTPEYVPTKSEIFKMADSAGSLKARAIILFIFSTGIRNSTLRALRCLDVWEELEERISTVKVPIYIGMKRIIDNACKCQTEYYTFLFEEALEALRLYLNDRVAKYGEMALEMPLFHSDFRRIRLSQRTWAFLTDRELQRIVKLAAKRAGIAKWRYVKPTSVRKSYESVLRTPMSDGDNLDPKIQVFMMGHLLTGSEDNYLDRDKVEELRILHSKLKFGRVNIENKFTVVQNAIRAAFAGTNIDPEQAIEDYVRARHLKAA